MADPRPVSSQPSPPQAQRASRPMRSPHPEPADTTHGNLWLRIYWMAAGNLLLLAMALAIIANPIGLVPLVGFWVVAGSLGLARYLDVTRHDGETADGKPATAADLRTYLIGLTVGSAVLFGLALVIGQAW